jgi:hypothetical protein
MNWARTLALAVAMSGYGCSRDATRSGAQGANYAEHDRPRWQREMRTLDPEPMKDVPQESAKATEQAEMKGGIRAALDEARDMTIRDLEVNVNDHKVVISGSVDTKGGRKRLEQIARAVAGSDYFIENRVAVRR